MLRSLLADHPCTLGNLPVGASLFPSTLRVPHLAAARVSISLPAPSKWARKVATVVLLALFRERPTIGPLTRDQCVCKHIGIVVSIYGNGRR